MPGESRFLIVFLLCGIAVACGSASSDALFAGSESASSGGTLGVAGGLNPPHVGAGGASAGRGGTVAMGGFQENNGGSVIAAGGANFGGTGSVASGGTAPGGSGSGSAPQSGGSDNGGSGSGGKVVVAAPTCTDGQKNGDETALDCGGPTCPPCGPGLDCVLARDCDSGVCTGLLLRRTCRDATCIDLTRNGAETDTDCGGPNCSPCNNGGSCLVPRDCASGACEGNVCVCKRLTCADIAHACGTLSDGCGATITCPACSTLCNDKTKDGNETATDCGGLDCKACGDGLACATARDCTSHVCAAASTGATPTCRPFSCLDKVKNGAETDVDCGGGTCPACNTGQTCGQNSDCKQGPCDNNKKCTCAPRQCGQFECGKVDNGCGGMMDCQPCSNLCTDHVQDGMETLIDCGGPDCSPCS